jgi:hypothetical protein
MLGPTDQGHFLKYLTTLGVAIVVASLGLGGYLLQTQSDLLIKREELAKLTPVAREAIDHKQQVALQVTTFAPWVLGLMALGGVIMAVIGLTSWRKKQALLDKRDDERAQAEVAKINRELELMQMTDQEKQEIKAAQAEELVVDEAAENIDPVVRSQSAVNAGRRVENAVEKLFDKLRQGFPDATIRQDIKFGPSAVDALAVLEKKRQLLAFELRITTPQNFRHRLMEATLALANTMRAAAAEFDSYRAISVFVVLVRGGKDAMQLDWRRRVREVSAAAGHWPVVLMYDEVAWDSLSADEFRADIDKEYRRRPR